MSEEIITIPCNIETLTALSFSKRLQMIQEANKYNFDLKYLKKVRPFGMLLTGAAIRQFIKARKESSQNKAKFQVSNFNESISAHGYAAHVGFFRSWGAPYGNKPSEGCATSGCKPIRRINVKDVKEKASEDFVHPGEVLEDAAEEFATFLLQDHNDLAIGTLTYSIREILRNVVEHSKAKHIWLVGQYWPTYEKVEIAILDEGIGLEKSLKGNPKIEILNAENAIHLALQPGISGKLNGRKKRRGKNKVWDNSGYGLYVTSSLCKEDGQYCIASGGKSILLNGDKVTINNCFFDGTAVMMTIDTSKVKQLKEHLEDIISKGEKIIKESGVTGNLSASLITGNLKNWLK